MDKISWISCDCFVDTDLPIVCRLQSYYKILLIIVVAKGNNINYESYVLNGLEKCPNVEVKFIYLTHRFRSIFNISDYIRLITEAKRFVPNIYYIAFQGMPYGVLLYKFMLPIHKCIVSCHNVSTPKGATNGNLANFTTKMWLNSFTNINVFSRFQADELNRRYPSKRILETPFFLKDYGQLKHNIDKKNQATIRFLSFGNIVAYKRIDLLIVATNLLVERGIKKFVVRIAGNCKNWGDYEKLIKYPDKIELQIERIPNEEIPALFEDSHYFMLPYQDIAQSGSISIAFNYNLPTIVSDIPQFDEFVVNNQTSLSFKSQNAESLADTMQYAIEHHHEIYESLCKRQKRFVDEKFSDRPIIEKYKTFFNSL